jgi:hypothetical protein
VTAEPESQNKVENKRAHMLRNPMLGGGRNVLQEMLKGACSNPVAFVLSLSLSFFFAVLTVAPACVCVQTRKWRRSAGSGES